MPSHIQYGHGMPVFVGRRIQRGNGIGGVFGSLAKSILLPAIKNIGTSLLQSGLEKATGAVQDIGQGKSIKNAFRDQFLGDHTPTTLARSGVKRAAHFLHDLTDGRQRAPRKKRARSARSRSTRPNHRRANSRRRKRHSDVFDTL